MIKLQVIGNLGRDCVTNTVNGKNVMNFTVAHTEKYKDSTGAQREKTIWVDCAYWSDRTGLAPYLKKGTQVYVEGAPEVRTYQTQDGKSGAALSVRVSSIQLLGSRSSEAGSGGGGGYQQQGGGYNAPSPSMEPPIGGDVADDLPF